MRIKKYYSANTCKMTVLENYKLPYLFEWAPNLELAPTSNKRYKGRKSVISDQPRISAHPLLLPIKLK